MIKNEGWIQDNPDVIQNVLRPILQAFRGVSTVNSQLKQYLSQISLETAEDSEIVDFFCSNSEILFKNREKVFSPFIHDDIVWRILNLDSSSFKEITKDLLKETLIE